MRAALLAVCIAVVLVLVAFGSPNRTAEDSPGWSDLNGPSFTANDSRMVSDMTYCPKDGVWSTEWHDC